MTDEQLMIHLGNLRAALRGEMLVGLPPDKVLKIAVLQVDALMKRVADRSKLEGISH